MFGPVRAPDVKRRLSPRNADWRLIRIFTRRAPRLHNLCRAAAETAARAAGLTPRGATTVKGTLFMTRIRLLGVSAALVAVGVTAVPTTASAAPVITMSGSTSVAPLASLLAKRVPQAVPRPRQVQARPGRLGRRRRRRRRRPRHDRQLLARPEVERSGRPLLQQDRQGRDLHRHQPRQRARPTCRRRRSRRSSPARSATGARSPARTATGTIDLVVRTAASGTQDAFQKIFMGSTSVLGARSAKASNGLVQQAVQSDQNAIGYVSLDFVNGTQHDAATTASRATCATPSPASTAACATSGWSPAAARSRQRAPEVHHLGRRTRPRRRRSSASTGCRSSRCSSGSAAHGRTGAPSVLLGALACTVLAGDRAHGGVRRDPQAWPSFQHNGLVVVLGAGGNVDQQLDAMVNAGANPPPLGLHARAPGR